jgi:membrane protein implicated in regulation of membrane protease activity
LSQSRVGSVLEAIANVALGYWIAIAAQMAIFPLFGVNLPLGDNLLIGLLFTVVSLVRGYALRRLFNRLRNL